ncbi:chemotaxis protein CheA [Ideonella oryzae]|uniref:Chemotaxis protein CheA n=1 Tax=Ideonella oryzae TaxID=2937441 RepID=A0ABT1BNR9_9BURK|nr:chemotaxis protein CheA [Ideonella oryzae]MCO5977855.1 chemotaxis protein CheA [Ideonella oryzae]
MDMDQALPTFLAESRELLEEMEGALLSVLDSEERHELVNAIFRAAHTIKGSAGLFGLDGVVRFTHVLESLLDRVREGELTLDEALVGLLLESRDHMSLQVDAIGRGEDASEAAWAERNAPLLGRLQQHLGTPAATAPAQDSSTPATGGLDHWHLSLRFGPEVLRNGMDPLSFIRYLGRLGTLTGVVTLEDRLPPLSQMDPEACYLGFEIGLDSRADKATIESTFEFVLDDAEVRIVPPCSKVSEYFALIQRAGEEPPRLGEILLRCGSLTEHELAQALAQQQATPAAPLGEILVEQGLVLPALVDAALTRQQQVKEAHGSAGSSGAGTIRVDAQKLDHLINLVGEMITAAAGASLAARRSGDGPSIEATSLLAGLVEDMRDSALQLRMVKIGATFGRFRRVVHDVSQELGKDIVLAIHGEDTELDKTVVEKIADPLTHLVRNAMDHGIESAERRAESGKPVQGTLTLNAFHDSGSIVIEVSDDGGGLDRERILAKGVERGLIEPGEVLSDSQVYNLIFEPGFSTAEKVTNLSGRGVGMDVVKRNITALRGSVHIDSRPGQGTTVSVRLPLTLAIINGFQVGVGGAVFVLPLEMVEECVAFSAEPDRDYTNLRGQVLPFLRLRELFELPGQPGPRENIVVLRHGSQRMGLVVDRLLGEAQTVIKPLSKVFARVQGLAGSSIQGNGEVALILDVPSLMNRVLDRAERSTHAA